MIYLVAHGFHSLKNNVKYAKMIMYQKSRVLKSMKYSKLLDIQKANRFCQQQLLKKVLKSFEKESEQAIINIRFMNFLSKKHVFKGW